MKYYYIKLDIMIFYYYEKYMYELFIDSLGDNYIYLFLVINS